MQERAQRYLDQPALVRDIIADGNAKAGKLARETMRDVRAAIAQISENATEFDYEE